MIPDKPTATLGLDPGLAQAGGALLDNTTKEIVATKHFTSPTNANWIQRAHDTLCEIRDFIITSDYTIDMIVTEGASYSSPRQRKTRTYVQALQVNGLILGILGAQVPVIFIPPASLKLLALGKGNGNLKKDKATALLRIKYNDAEEPYKYSSHELDAMELAKVGLGIQIHPQKENTVLFSNEQVQDKEFAMCRGNVSFVF